MPKCPKCEREINHLIYVRLVVEERDVRLKKGKAKYGTPYMSGEDEWYECPLCGEEITDDEYEAERFLEGDKWWFLKKSW